MKEKAWRGEFTDLNLLLKSAPESSLTTITYKGI
jgi:hypothetical protein